MHVRPDFYRPKINETDFDLLDKFFFAKVHLKIKWPRISFEVMIITFSSGWPYRTHIATLVYFE